MLSDATGTLSGFLCVPFEGRLASLKKTEHWTFVTHFLLSRDVLSYGLYVNLIDVLVDLF